MFIFFKKLDFQCIIVNYKLCIYVCVYVHMYALCVGTFVFFLDGGGGCYFIVSIKYSQCCW